MAYDDYIWTPLVQPDGTEETIEERFLRFHEANPHVYDTIVKIALDLKVRGFRTSSINLIFERMRWLYAIKTQGEQYRLNNTYRAHYARMVMREHAELEGFFKTRVQRTAKGEEVREDDSPEDEDPFASFGFGT